MHHTHFKSTNQLLYDEREREGGTEREREREREREGGREREGVSVCV